MKAFVLNLVRKCIHSCFGISGIRLFWDKKKRKFNSYFYRSKFDVNDLRREFEKSGVIAGSTVLLHSSFSEFYNYRGTPNSIIDLLLSMIGDTGTLLMPSYFKDKREIYSEIRANEKYVVDFESIRSGAGILTEIFRQYPNVIRSINLQHSVVGVGKLAKELLSSHQFSITAWDNNSPYYKLTQMDAIILSLGLKPYLRNVTLFHCIESYLFRVDGRFKFLFNEKIECNFKSSVFGEGLTSVILPRFQLVRSKNFVLSLVKKNLIYRSKLSNVLIESVNSRVYWNEIVKNVDNGISVFENGVEKIDSNLKKFSIYD